MLTQADPNVKVRVPLSRDRVLREAMRLADERGISSLTMRGLARVLGVEAMTLYYHVANKDDILDGIFDLAVAEIEVPAGEAGWKTETRQRAISAHEVFVRHPWAGAMWWSRDLGPARLRYMDSALRGLREGGLSPEMTERAYHAVENYILGYTLQELSFPLDATDMAEVGASFLQQLPVDDYPYLAERQAASRTRRPHRRGRVRVRAGSDPRRTGEDPGDGLNEDPGQGLVVGWHRSREPPEWPMRVPGTDRPGPDRPTGDFAPLTDIGTVRWSIQP